jgi:CheY-like chemotaxis protein
LISEIGRASEQEARGQILANLSREITSLKSSANLQELLPIWQMATALEGLLGQLSRKGVTLSPTTLRSLTGGVDVLTALCIPGLKSDITTNPPVKLLAVDDDQLSRHAVSFALKKAFEQPDLAVNGESALAMAEQHSYDVIFLDVQMPGMNGYELCSKIRETKANQTAPVVFVTCLNDLNSRAESTLSGGDLIVKPFLTFEIAVIALTKVLRRRLQLDKNELPIRSRKQESASTEPMVAAIPQPQPSS